MSDDRSVTWAEVRDGLRAFIAKRLSNSAEVDDLLQDVFLRMHRKLDSVKDPGKVVPWLYQVTRRAIIDHYRDPARRREMPLGLAVEFQADTPSSAEAGAVDDRLRGELAACVRPMIDRLSDGARQAVTLVELEGLTQAEAAKRLGLSLSGMKSRVQRGRRELKRMLDDCCVIQLDGRRGVADFRVRDPRASPCGGASRTDCSAAGPDPVLTIRSTRDSI